MSEQWTEWRSAEQNKLLQPACRDLSRGLRWDGVQLSPDEWRWLVCADILGQKPVRGIHGGVVLLGGSSRKLTKEKATEAITLAFSIGDAPWDYGLVNQVRVTWCEVVTKARGISPNDDALADRYA
jgi:hypothetical protein